MKKFNVSIPYYASVFIEVEAKNKKAAIKKAYAEVCPTVCVYCSRQIEIDEPLDDAEPSVYEVKE